MKKKILTIGGKGLVGSRITQLLSDKYVFEDVSRSSGINITDKQAITEKIKNSNASIILHLAAKTDVEACEKDKQEDSDILRYKDTKNQEKTFAKMQTAWAINVIGTRNVAEACESSEKKMIYISTDFVFGEEAPREEGFTENDQPMPVNWYGKTKYEGEKMVQNIKSPWVILRLSYPYRAEFEKKEYVRIFLSLLQQKKEIKAITDHIITPTFIDDIATALDVFIQKEQTGIFHVTGSQPITPYEVCMRVAEVFDLDTSLIGKTTRREFFKGRAKRPFNLSMNNGKITQLGIKMKSFGEGLREMKRQLDHTNS